MNEKRKGILAKFILSACACGFLILLGKGLLEELFPIGSKSESVGKFRVYYTSISEITMDLPLPTTTEVSTTGTEFVSTSGSEQTVTTETTISVVYPLNLNCATAEELATLSGIGEVLAERIVDYRTSCGGFINRVQLLDVEGIGEVVYAAIYDQVYIENEQEWIPDNNSEKELTDEDNNEFFESWEESNVTEESPVPFTGVLNLNQATAEELSQLPDVDAELAQRIVTLRETIIEFSSVYELLYVEGVTPELFDKIRNYVTVEP